MLRKCLQISIGYGDRDNEVNKSNNDTSPALKWENNTTVSYQKKMFQEVAPDGGWGWVICLATFLCHFVVGGTYYSYGIMLPHLIDQFNSDHVTISMIGSGEQ